jgi:hypothetical protein
MISILDVEAKREGRHEVADMFWGLANKIAPPEMSRLAGAREGRADYVRNTLLIHPWLLNLHLRRTGGPLALRYGTGPPKI